MFRNRAPYPPIWPWKSVLVLLFLFLYLWFFEIPLWITGGNGLFETAEEFSARMEGYRELFAQGPVVAKNEGRYLSRLLNIIFFYALLFVIFLPRLAIYPIFYASISLQFRAWDSWTADFARKAFLSLDNFAAYKDSVIEMLIVAYIPVISLYLLYPQLSQDLAFWIRNKGKPEG